MVTKKSEPASTGIIVEPDGTLKFDGVTIAPAAPPALTNRATQRLIITQLAVRDFKSYAGEQTLGPFNKNFTAVVGSNGSGKSNVIDALLFVFGYRARRIRSKKLSHLIHNSSKFPNITSCQVTVSFATIKDFTNSYTIVPGSQFDLSRTAFADDSSLYELQHKRVSYKTVTETLRAHGIDLEHSRFLILQGEVEAISLMRPKGLNENDTGMLEHIEEIIGSNRFIEHIKQTQETLAKLEEVKELKSNMLQHVEKERDELQAPRDKAIKYLKLQNQLILLENSLLHLKRMDATKDLEVAVKNKNNLFGLLSDVKTSFEDLKVSKKSLESELDKVIKEYESYQSIFEDCKEKFTQLESKDVACFENIKNAIHKNEKLEYSLQEAKNELSKLMKQSAVFEKETAELDEQKKKYEARKQTEEEKETEVRGSIKQETNVLKEDKDKLEKELKKLKNKVLKIKSEVDLAQNELDIYVNEMKKEENNLSDLLKNHEEAVKLVKEDEEFLTRQEKKISEIEAELSSLKECYSSSKQKEASLSEELQRSRINYEEAKNSLHSHRHRSTMMQAFMKEKANGRFLGVFGRLGDLGAIDEKYDVAISTACPKLDWIVTDTVQTAQNCIKFLKENNLAYATFIPLEKMKVWESHTLRKVVTPENIPRLYDLVHVKDKKLLTAFYFALGETLVANDIDQATRIALQGSQRYRVVTLKGDLIDFSGTMSGGGNRALRGRMGQKILESNLSSEDVSKMGAELDVLTKSFSDLKRSCVKMEEEISQKTKSLSSLLHAVKLRKQRYDANQKKINMMEAQIAEQKKKTKASEMDVNKVKALEEEIKEKTKILSEESEKASAVEEKIVRLQDDIIKISTGKLSKVQKHVSEITVKINHISNSLTKSLSNVKASKKNIKKLEEKITKIEKTINENKDLIKSMKAERNEITEKGKAVNDKKIEAEGEMLKCKEKRADVKKKMEEISKKDHELKSKEIELKNELKKCEQTEKELKGTLENINGKLSKLKLNEVENESMLIPSLTPDEVSRLSYETLMNDIEMTKVYMEDKPDISVIQQYNQKDALCAEKQRELTEIMNEKNMYSSRCEELRKRRLQEFMNGFKEIAGKLKEIYQMLTLGGDAELELLDSSDPFTKGVEFSARPPKKSWKYMRNLSGGEKTLSSLSLVFALHYYRPTPFYVMDEIDAALDERNVALVREYLKRQTDTQLINVSLRNIMNEESEHLLGIYKRNNCSLFTKISNVSEWYCKNGYVN